jgi:hypothetical protein
LSALAQRHRSIRHLLPNAIYYACEAKFAAESALGVGRETWVTILAPDGRRCSYLSDAIVQSMRTEWERVGRPRKPTRALRTLYQWGKKTDWMDWAKPDTDKAKKPAPRVRSGSKRARKSATGSASPRRRQN